MAYALGIDASTQSCSAMVIDTERGEIVADASVSFGKDLPRYGAPSGFIAGGKQGEVHSDPQMWLDALEIVLEKLKGQCDMARIESISGAGQQHGSVYLNSKWLATVSSLDAGHSLSAQLGPCLSRSTSPIWMDTSTGDECREIAAAVGGEEVVCAKSGSIAIERFTGPQIRRFFKNDPDGYAATSRIHLVSSFLCSVLCGGDAPIDTGDGAGMNLVNIGTWSWDADLMDATAPGLADKLPPVVAGSARAGSIAPYFVKKFGFTADTPVVVFTGDNPSSLVGMGATKPGKLVISLGTSDTFFAAMPEVVADPAGSGHVFGNPAGGSMSLQCFVNGSLAREEVKDRFEYDWNDFTSALEHTPPGNEGNLMVPFFRPEISPRIDLPEPIFSGSTAFITGECPDAVIRACVEGQFLNMKLRTAWMGLSTKTIYLTGGASANDGIAQVVADIFQAEVQRLAVSGSVALGGAIRAASYQSGAEIEALQAVFCQPVAGSEIRPSVGAECYAGLLEEFQALLG